jgi:hypothetical protein
MIGIDASLSMGDTDVTSGAAGVTPRALPIVPS